MTETTTQREARISYEKARDRYAIAQKDRMVGKIKFDEFERTFNNMKAKHSAMYSAYKVEAGGE